MDTKWKTGLWQQVGASIDMLEKNIRACPDELWTASLWTEDPVQPVWSQVWYIVYHTLFWTDFYLYAKKEGFMPPPPYTLDETDPAGVVPDRVYSKDEMLTYLAYCRNNCRETLLAMTDERAHEIVLTGMRDMPYFELQIYNMRHLQEHGAQIALLIGQNTGYSPGWVSKAKTN